MGKVAPSKTQMFCRVPTMLLCLFHPTVMLLPLFFFLYHLNEPARVKVEVKILGKRTVSTITFPLYGLLSNYLVAL
jgi:hypothetical protein